MSIWQIVLSAAFIVILSYIIYKILDESKNFKKDKIIENSRYIEKKIEEMVEVDRTKLLKKYRNMIKESVLGSYHINIYMLILFSIVAAGWVFNETKVVFNQSIAAALIAAVAFTLPFNLMEIEVSFRRRSVRTHLPHLLLMFLQTYEVTGDAFKTLQTIKNNIKAPLQDYIGEYIKDIQKGMGTKEAINNLKNRTDNEVFKSFCDNIYMEMEHGKMVKAEIEKDVKDAFTHEENYIQRLTENSGNIISLVLIFGAFILGINRIAQINDEFIYILKNNAEGKLVVDAVIIILIVVLYFIKTSISYKDN